MKRFTAVFVIISFLVFSISAYINPVSAEEMITEAISSVDKAKEIAGAAGGSYWEGAAAPAVSGKEVALPVIDKATGEVLGHIVAEQGNLVSALNAAGYTQVASAVAAAEVGTGAGLMVGTGVAMGTIGAVALGAVVIGGVALAVGGGGGGGTTSSHH